MKNQSLQDQLLNAGLVSENKAKQARAEKRKQNKKKRNNKLEFIDETKQALQEKKAEQAAKDKQLNEQRQQLAEQQQIANQVRQLVEKNRLPQESGEDGIAYHFNDRDKVKTIYLNKEMRDKVIAGKLAIVRLEQQYEVVSADVAERIGACADDAVVVLFGADSDSSTEDEYADYKIPDDLMW
ncbi:DUF2058 domain-containing protein [Methylomarinum vadi]|uniref:DUF2058 domain-containing protein n=1 Tax=Methylomarinum vadi TaxID=438855 RepID=UPI0004DF3734|nr:DUF2058 domain-containing protein [Methylomarinum vadi]